MIKVSSNGNSVCCNMVLVMVRMVVVHLAQPNRYRNESNDLMEGVYDATVRLGAIPRRRLRH